MAKMLSQILCMVFRLGPGIIGEKICKFDHENLRLLEKAPNCNDNHSDFTQDANTHNADHDSDDDTQSLGTDNHTHSDDDHSQDNTQSLVFPTRDSSSWFIMTMYISSAGNAQIKELRGLSQNISVIMTLSPYPPPLASWL